MYALIVDGVVREVFADAPHLHESLDVRDVSDVVGIAQNWIIDGEGSFLPPQTSLVAIDGLKAALKASVDVAAENERLKYITPGHGQAMTYQQKVAEAQTFKAAINPQPTDYPILSSEVGITADTLAEVADIVLAAFAQWQQIGAMIESIRLGAKRDIDAAKDEAAARAIVDAIVWPSAS
ncbi:hypothetical protein M8994_18295 [Brucella sp. 21LCYQ03]|nr:hypothetical protein [Brucella sp. 21LCYQ03]